MKILHEIINSIRDNHPIKRICVGAHWTAVTAKHTGMASTVMLEKTHGKDIVKDAGILNKKNSKELINYALSNNSLEASIGTACINACLTIPDKHIQEINGFDIVVRKGKNKTIAVFGHFPAVNGLRKIAEKVYLFEMDPVADEYSLDLVPDHLPKADVVAITSNSIINHTLENILPYIQPKAFRIMVGPSTPLTPILFDHGIDMLAGVRVINDDMLFSSVSQGAMFKQVKGVELITLVK